MGEKEGCAWPTPSSATRYPTILHNAAHNVVGSTRRQSIVELAVPCGHRFQYSVSVH